MSRTATVELACRVVSDDPTKRAIAVWDGVSMEDGPHDPSTGEIKQRPHWCWLPRSQIEIEPQRDGTAIVSLPEWLALAKGLI